jgi:hypothetical protein
MVHRVPLNRATNACCTDVSPLTSQLTAPTATHCAGAAHDTLVSEPLL